MVETYKQIDIYLYDPTTKEFLYKGISDKNPLNPDEPIIPACATTVMPPEFTKGYAIVWAGNKWKKLEDHRGETYYNTTTESKEVINFLGNIPDIYVSTDSVRANKPDGDYWEYDSNTDQWVANVLEYKKHLITDLIPNEWNAKFAKEFEFNGFYYLPSWKTLYNEIYTMLRDDIRENYRLRDNHSQYNVVDKNSMKLIISCMSDIVDKIYLDKQDLYDYLLKQNDYNKLVKAYETWLKK